MKKFDLKSIVAKRAAKPTESAAPGKVQVFAARPKVATVLPVRGKAPAIIGTDSLGLLPKMESWSLSRWKDWHACPRQAYFKHVARMKTPGSPAMDRGIFAHKGCEDLTLGAITFAQAQKLLQQAGDRKLYGDRATPISLEPFKKNFAEALKRGAIAEQAWAFHEDWSEADWFKGPWIRVKLDAAFMRSKNTLVVVDHKTGRVYDDHKDDADLYCLAGMRKYPKAEIVVAEFWYLDQGVIGPGPGYGDPYYRDQEKEIAQKWADKVAPMLSDVKYPCKPNPKCKFCHFRSSNGAAFPEGVAPCRWG